MGRPVFCGGYHGEPAGQWPVDCCLESRRHRAQMPRPVEAIIDLEAMRNNLAVARRHAAHAGVFAVVKADAYGHGLERVLPALEAADGFAVIEPDAALLIRRTGITKPVLMLEGFFDEQEMLMASVHRLDTVVHEPSQVDRVVSARLPQPLTVFIKVNTGMNRLGFPLEALAAVREKLVSSPNVGEVLAMTHFADADGERGVDWQLQPLSQAATSLRLKICAANSAALLRYPHSCGAWVRPGIMLYGASPFEDMPGPGLGLRPVMTLRSRIIGVQDLAPGDCLGYGCTFIADKAMRIGIVAAGYGDGYPRHAPRGTPVLVDGRRASTIGRVSMDTLFVDLSSLPGAGAHSTVTLWGEGLPVEEIAGAAGTVSYELLTKVTRRVPFVMRHASG